MSTKKTNAPTVQESDKAGDAAEKNPATPPKPAKKGATPPATETIPSPPEPPKRPKLKFVKESIALAFLTFSSKHQAREVIDKEAVADYTEKAKEAAAKGAEWELPAIRAVRRGEETFVFSGFTRGKALKNAGVTETKIEVAVCDDISDAEIFRLAVEANALHGVRLTNADKMHNLHRALKFPEYAELATNALVPIVGASEFFIRQHRPASASPSVRKTAKGKAIKTGNIGKKGGKTKAPGKKAAAAAANLARNAEQPDLGLDENGEPNKTPAAAEPKLDDNATRYVNRIAFVLDGHEGFTAKGIRDAVEEGTLKLSTSELNLWQATSDGRVRRMAPLIVGLGWPVKKAMALIDKEIDSGTKLEHLINLALTTGGAVRHTTIEPGEKISDNKTYTALVFDNTKYKVTLEPK